MFSAERGCWFVRKVICWRAAASIVWAVLLLPPVTAVFVFLSRFSLLHPIHWISECLSLLTSANAMLSFILLCGVVVVVGFFNLEYYTVIPSIACSKIALLGQLLHPRQFFHSLVHCALGVIVAWCCAITIGPRYWTLSSLCTSDDGSPQMCLNEYHFVLLLSGAFIGYSHSLLGVIHNMNYVSFHPVQQYKYLRFKGALPSVVKYSATRAFYAIRNYLVVYFFLGYIPRSWICNTLNLQLNSSLYPVDTIGGLLDLSLLYHLWISGTFLLLTWYITVLLFRIFLTEVYSFPVQSLFVENTHQCLPKVLTAKHSMVLKFLALQDLALLSQHSLSQRLEVFSLSQPGGHPHNWNAISGECLSLLADLTHRLVAHHDTVATNGRAKTQSTGCDKRSSSSDGSEHLLTPRPSVLLRTPALGLSHPFLGGLQSPVTAPFTPDFDSPFSSPAVRRLAGPASPANAAELLSPWSNTLQSPHVMRRGPKLWSASTESQSNCSLVSSPASLPSPAPAVCKPSLLAQFLHNRKEQVKRFLSKRVLIMYLFNKSRYVGYYESMKTKFNRKLPPPQSLKVKSIRIHSIAGVGRGDGSDLRVKIIVRKELVFQCVCAKQENCAVFPDMGSNAIVISLQNGPVVDGDVKVMFESSAGLPKGYEDCPFYFWFNTSFIEDNKLFLSREELDNPHKAKTWDLYKQDFGVTMFFSDPE